MALSTGCLFLFGLIVFLIAAGAAWIVSPGLPGSLPLLAIVLVFAAAGIVLVTWAWKSVGSSRDQRLREARHPGSPWLWREDWEQGFARANGRSGPLFRMSAVPGVLGGRLQGSVETGSPAPAGATMELVLNCVSWRGAGRTASSQILWQENSTVAVSPGAGGAVAPVDFEIPFDVRPTGHYGNTERVFWRLTARLADGGPAWSFTVPVFQTGESDAGHTRERMEAQAGSRLAGYSPAPGRIEKSVAPEGIRYRFPRARNRSAAALATFFGLVFLGIAYLLVLPFGLWLESIGGFLGALLATLIGVTALVGGIWLWFGETTVTAASGELRVHSSCLGVSRIRTVAARDIRGFEIKLALQKGADVWYDVRVQLGSGKGVNAGTGMDKTEAEWFVAELRRDLGIV